MKKVGFIIVGLLMTLAAVAQEIAVEQKIDSIAILIGQQAHMTVGVTAKKGQRVVFPQFKRTQQITPGVEVLESTPADTTSLDNGMILQMLFLVLSKKCFGLKKEDTLLTIVMEYTKIFPFVLI